MPLLNILNLFVKWAIFYLRCQHATLCNWKTVTGISNHLMLSIIHSCCPLSLAETWGQGRRWPRKEGRRLLLPSTCLTPSHLINLGTGALVIHKGEKASAEAISGAPSCFSITQFRTLELRVIPLDSGNNFCTYLYHNLTTSWERLFSQSNDQSRLYIMYGQDTGL